MSSLTRQAQHAWACRARLSVAACIMLGGCAHYEPEPLVPAESLSRLESRTLDDPLLLEFIEATVGRKPATGHLSWDLATLTAAALYYQPDIPLVQSALQAAQAASITAHQRPNPTLSLDMSFSPTTVSPVIDFLIETFGRPGYRTARARALVDAARYDVAVAAWQVYGRVRKALLRLWAAESKTSLERRRLELQEQLVGLLERRLAEGMVSGLDVARERGSRDQVSLAVREAEGQRNAARAELAAAVGVPLRAFDGVALSFAAFEPKPERPDTERAAELRRDALLERADLRALLARHAASDAALRLEIARQFPSFRLGLSNNYEFGVNEHEVGVSVGAELPVLNRNQGPIAEAEAGRREAASQFTALQANILGAIDSALESYDSAARTMATAEASLTDARDRSDRISRALSDGAENRVTLVSAQLQVAVAELARSDAGARLYGVLGVLEDALRQPLFKADMPSLVTIAGDLDASGSEP
jgi:cobalt-zinc-cadmium efflux system outer membrane protein